MYEYKMVQVPPNINVQAKNAGNEAAVYLESIANKYSEQGWEFYRVDSVGVNVQPGCLAGAFGGKAVLSTYFVITFRKPRND
jgi:hypothetical protein